MSPRMVDIEDLFQKAVQRRMRLWSEGRQLNRQKRLIPERKSKLDGIEFDWNPIDTKKRKLVEARAEKKRQMNLWESSGFAQYPIFM